MRQSGAGVPALRRQRRCSIDDVRQVRPGKAGRRAIESNHTSWASCTRRTCTRRTASRPVRSGRSTIKPLKVTRAEQCRVGHFGTIGRGQRDERPVLIEAIHLCLALI